MLLHLTYSQGLLGLKMMYLISENHKKSLLHRTVLVCHNLYCSFAIYAVLMHSMLLDCNMCCFIAVHATLIPFCCNLRCFVAAIWLLQNTRFPRHFWGGSQALSTFNDVCPGGPGGHQGAPGATRLLPTPKWVIKQQNNGSKPWLKVPKVCPDPKGMVFIQFWGIWGHLHA